MSETVHVVPQDDLIEHDTDTDTEDPTCVCGPNHRCEDDGWVIVHHALDGRQ